MPPRTAMAINNRYRMYLKSPQWKRKRQECFAYYGKRCYACRRPGTNVHHLSYQNLTREPLSDLMVLCTNCHDFVTKLHRKNRRRGHRVNTFIAIKLIRKAKNIVI